MLKNKTLLIYILVVGVFGILNTEMGIIGILPYVAETYGVDIVTAGLLISLFALGVAIAGPTMPLIFSQFPRKPVMLLVLGSFTLCNTISLFVTDFDLLLALRVLPSFFHPVYCAMAFSVAAELAGEKNAPKAVAKINVGVSAGMVIGVPISNFLAETFSLEASFAFFAAVTLLAFVATWIFVPSIAQGARLSYGSQLKALKRKMVWLSIFAVIFLNGSVFGVFNYLAEYLAKVTVAEPIFVSALLFVYGLCNILGSILAGNLLIKMPGATVKFFPFALSAVYVFIFSGGEILSFMAFLTIAWGILGGINANINQYWLSRAVPESSDFANGLFLTAANFGTMLGTAFSGGFIHRFGTASVVLGGLTFATLSALLVWKQCYGGFFEERARSSMGAA